MSHLHGPTILDVRSYNLRLSQKTCFEFIYQNSLNLFEIIINMILIVSPELITYEERPKHDNSKKKNINFLCLRK